MYKSNTKKLKKILSHPQIPTILEPQALNNIKKAVLTIENQIDPEKNKGTLPNEEVMKSIGGTLNFLLHLAMEKPITPIFKDLIDEFIILASYWNENAGKDIRVREAIHTLRRFVDYHLSVIDMLTIFKVLLKKTEQIQNFSPPAFELSKHYLNALESLDKETKRPAKKPKMGPVKNNLKRAKK